MNMPLKGIPHRIASTSSFASFFVAEAEGKFAIWKLEGKYIFVVGALYFNLGCTKN